VELHGQRPIGLLDLVGIGAARDTEHFVVVLLGHDQKSEFRNQKPEGLVVAIASIPSGFCHSGFWLLG
jgi:hypothetical protein